jgi:hypothetical protein
VKRNIAGLAVFVASLCFIVYVLGVATVQFDLWPNHFFSQAKNALIAVIDVAEGERKRTKLTGMEFIEPSSYTAPKAVSHASLENSGDELIFIDGGNNQLRSHCPDYGCIAWLTDRAGKIRHIWDIGSKLIWEDISQVAGFEVAKNAYSVGAQLFPNGDLLVVYQGWKTFPYGIGVARFDSNSNLLWKKENFAHHWVTVDDEGFIYLTAFRKVQLPYRLPNTNLQINCPKGGLYEDTILILDPDGNTVDEISIFESLVESGYGGAIFQHRHPDFPLPLTANDCDPTHLNDVRVISTEMAADSELLTAGDLLISLRSMNTIAVLDRETKLVKWLSFGRTVQQHSPRYLGNDEVLLFDNLGGQTKMGGSRLIKVNMLNDAAKTVFPREDESKPTDFLSATAGHIALSKNKDRALVSLARQGRGLEIDLKTGQILWEYINTHDVSHIIPSEDGEPVYGRFAIQTMQYVDELEFELNNGVIKQ